MRCFVRGPGRVAGTWAALRAALHLQCIYGASAVHPTGAPGGCAVAAERLQRWGTACRPALSGSVVGVVRTVGLRGWSDGQCHSGAGSASASAAHPAREEGISAHPARAKGVSCAPSAKGRGQPRTQREKKRLPRMLKHTIATEATSSAKAAVLLRRFSLACRVGWRGVRVGGSGSGGGGGGGVCVCVCGRGP